MILCVFNEMFPFNRMVLIRRIHPQRTQNRLKNYLEQAKGVSFSNHAQRRLQVRSIEIDDEGIGRLSKCCK